MGLSRLGMGALLLALVIAPVVSSQEPEQKSETRYAFFSGNVSEVTDEKLTVARTVLGRKPETRTFVLTPETQVEGELKPKCRVTVGFTVNDQGNVAKRIIVRRKQVSANQPRR